MTSHFARLGYRLVVVCLLFSLLPDASNPLTQDALAQENENGLEPIFLKAGTLYPEPGAPVEEVAPGRRGYYIVQFQGPVQEEWKAEVAALGGEVLDYLPVNAFKVRMTHGEATEVEALDSVTWVGPFRPAYKIAPGVDLHETQMYRLRIERGSEAVQAIAAIVLSGAQIIRSKGNILFVVADASQVAAMAAVLDVAWIEPFQFHEKHSDYGAGVVLGASSVNANGYDGSTQIVAVADTGIGGGTAATAHAGIPASRVEAIYDWTTGNARQCYRVYGDGARDPDSGHGTHVAVSVLGGGSADGTGRGTAPAAKLVFQAIEDYLDLFGACASPNTPDGYYLIGIPDDLRQLYQQAYAAGARVHSNSWGSDVAGDYTLDSANSDAFVWSNPDMAITFSAGNTGIDGNGDGIVDSDSMGAPATAKNVIAVGASENDREGSYPCDTGLVYLSHDAYQPDTTCSGMSGQNILGTYSTRWPTEFPANPIADDPTAGNKEQMAGFSSRGPTDDGRIKPDIVAPGTWVLAGYSSLFREGYGDPLNAQNSAYQLDGWGMPLNAEYKYYGGTSMANPIVAGGAAVVRDYYQKAHDHNASAALVKATLINSAVDMLDENNDGSDDNDFPIPNVHEGWGRVNLVDATDGSDPFVEHTTGLATGGSATYSYNVASAGTPFKVTLAWSDYPSTEAASVNLVNNLNLVVTAPDGTTVYRGNVFEGGWSEAGGSADMRNNVENVYVQAAAAGMWTVRVHGANVPQGPQPFALVVSGDVSEVVDTPPTVAITSLAEGETVSGTVSLVATATDDHDVTQVEFFVDGDRIGTDTRSTHGWSIEWNTALVANGSHTLTARATDTSNQSTTSAAVSVQVENETRTPVVGVSELTGSATAGSGERWNANVTVEIRDDGNALDPGSVISGSVISGTVVSGTVVSGAVVSGTWSGSVTGNGSCTTNGEGVCAVTQNNLASDATVTFTVRDVAKSGTVYIDPAPEPAITLDREGPVISASEEPQPRMFLPLVGK